MSVKAFDKNLTTTFLLFTLKINRSKIDKFNFNQAYIYDNQHINKFDNCLYLEFKLTKENKQSAEFFEFEKEMLASGIINDYYDFDDSTVFVVQVNKEFHDDLSKFMDGEYSKFSSKLKNRMNSVNDMLVRGIVDKEEYARVYMSKLYDINIPSTQEYCSKPNLKNEILRYE